MDASGKAKDEPPFFVMYDVGSTNILGGGMGAQEKVWTVIRALVGQANVLTIPRLFVDLAGSLETALFLSQLLYWSDKGKRTDGFIYKSRREWSEELALSEYAIRKATKKLKTMGLLETKLHRASGAPTLHYRLDQGALLNELLRFVEINKSDLSESTNQIRRGQQITNRDYAETTEHGGGDGEKQKQALASLLSVRGMNPVVARQWAQAYEPDRIAGWVEDAKSKPNLRNPAGYIGAMLKTREPAPTQGGDGKKRRGDLQTGICSKCSRVFAVEQICSDCGRCWECCECGETEEE